MLATVSCTSTVPGIGRRQLALVPEGTINRMAYQAYGDFLNQHRVVRDTPEAVMVQRVGRRVHEAVMRRFAGTEVEARLRAFSWEIHLVEDDQVNAWAMPGGKVVVYTGILKATQTEAGLATVVGHEIAHVVAGHGQERMSQALVAQAGAAGVGLYMRDRPEETQKMFLAAYGAAAQVGILLPYSRTQEYEADRLGVEFMARAGYDPREAVAFWERMRAMKSAGQHPPEFLSTHPADGKRIAELQSLMPKAMEWYERARPSTGATPSPAAPIRIVPPPSPAAPRPARNPFVR